LEDVARLYVALKRHHARLQPGSPRYQVADRRWAELAEKALEDSSLDLYVVENAAHVVAFMKLAYKEKPWGTSCEIETMIVESRHRNRRVGTLLLEQAERRAQEVGAGGLRVDVLLENYDGRRFYERAGYEAFSVRYGKPVSDPD
jgi:ribosomal protein S18 acetylase RimI-like enzyme